MGFRPSSGLLPPRRSRDGLRPPPLPVAGFPAPWHLPAPPGSFRACLTRHIRSQGFNPPSVFSRRRLPCRLKQGAPSGFRLQGFFLYGGRSRFRAPLPSWCLALFPGTLRIAVPGCSFKGSVPSQSPYARQPLFRRPATPFPSWRSPPWGFLPSRAFHPPAGFGPCRPAPRSVQLEARCAPVGVCLLRDRRPLRGSSHFPSWLSKTLRPLPPPCT